MQRALSSADFARAVDSCRLALGGENHRVALELLCLLAHAQAKHEEAVTYARRLAAAPGGDVLERARSLRLLATRLADIDLRSGWSDIRLLLEGGLDQARATPHEHVAQLTLLGDYALCRGDYDFGRELLAAAHEELARVGEDDLRAGLQAHVAIGHARDLLGRGETTEARRWLVEASAAAHAARDVYAEVLVRGYAARVLRVAGDAGGAIAELEVAISEAAEAPQTGFEDWAGLELELLYYSAEAFGAAGAWARAADILRDVAALANHAGSREVAAEALFLLAFSAVAGTLPSAVEALEAAAATASRLGYADIAADVERLKATRRFQRLAGRPVTQSNRLPAPSTTSSE